jgi:ATP-binding cassette, subfamily B, bacterial
MTGTVISAAWRLWRISVRQDARKARLSLLLVMAGSVAWPLVAVVLRQLFEAAVGGHVLSACLAGAAVAVLLIAALTLGHFAHIGYFELSELDVLELHQQLMEIVSGPPDLARQELPEFADQVAVLDEDIQQLRSGLQAVLTGVGLALAITITAVVLAGLDPLLLGLLLLALPPLLAGRWAERIADRARNVTAASTRQALNLFRLATAAASGKELRIFGLQEEVVIRHGRLWRSSTRRLWRGQLAAGVVQVGGQLLFSAGYVIAVLLIVRSAVAGQRGVGDIILVVTLAAQVNQQVAGAVGVLQDLQRLTSVFQRLATVQNLAGGEPAASAPAPLTTSRSLPPRRLRDGIQLEDVVFQYPGSSVPTLRGVSLRLPAGATVALVGENGSGKTTLVKLLCGFYQPTSGAITIDGEPMECLSLPHWRERIAAGFQDFMRLELSARRTVGVGDLPRLDHDPAVRTALDRAGASDLVAQLDTGLDTHLGKAYADGAELSGGQWQKLALGRAFMRDDPLLVVLDEPAAALDAAAEHALFERYWGQARQVAQRTGALSIFVSHRFSTTRTADMIVVLEGGKVLEVGDHATLVRSGGLYAELVGLHAKAYS